MVRDFNISDLEPNKDVRLIVKLRSQTFARTLLYLSIKFEEGDFVYTSDLTRFLKTGESYAYKVLREFENFGLLKREIVTSNLVMWKPIFNSNHPLLNKYVKIARKTLGIGK